VNECVKKPEFTVQQIKRCRKCRNASAKIKWCGKHSVHIRPLIILPGKELDLPSVGQMAKNFMSSAAKHIKAGMPKRSDVEQAKCMAICQGCIKFIPQSRLGPRCSDCGCCSGLATRWATKNCPDDKW